MGSNLAEETLPTKEELKCLLYPKNAKQMWDEYGEGRAEFDFYKGTEVIVKDAIERTHDIAWNLCEDVWIDTSVKLPKHVDKAHPERDEFQQLAAIVKTAMVAEGMADKPEYVARVKEELSDIKFLGHSSYFLTMTEIFKIAENRTLMGPGRGCFLPETRVKMSDGLMCSIENIEIGEKVIDAYGDQQIVLDKYVYDIDEEILELEFDDGIVIKCTKDHKFLTKNRGFVEAQNLTDDDVVVTV